MILKLNQTNMADVSESKWNQISTKCNEQSTSTKADSFTGKGITSLSRIALNVINKCYSVHNIFPYYFINTLYKQLYYIYPMRSFRKCWSTFRTRTFSVWLLLWKDILKLRITTDAGTAVTRFLEETQQVCIFEVITLFSTAIV